MAKLTDEELRRVRLAGKVAWCFEHILYLIVLGLILVIGVGLVIHYTGE